MSKVKTAVTPALTFRQMTPRDLLQVWRIEQQTAARRWTVQDFLTVLQSGHTVGQVAEVGDQVVGYVIYTVQNSRRLDEEEGRRPHHARLGGSRHETIDLPISLLLLHLVVAPDWRRRGVGLALLGRLGRKLRHADDCIQTTVPESNLSAQLLLRQAGYKAIRVLRGYFGAEDGYLLERRPS
jgi:ribosomal-protein-alanine N-acetyltransferase